MAVFLLVGFMLGLLSAVALLGFLVYWLCRGEKVAAARFLNGVALALAAKAKPRQRLPPASSGEVVPAEVKAGAVSHACERDGHCNSRPLVKDKQ